MLGFGVFRLQRLEKVDDKLTIPTTSCILAAPFLEYGLERGMSIFMLLVTTSYSSARNTVIPAGMSCFFGERSHLRFIEARRIEVHTLPVCMETSFLFYLRQVMFEDVI